MKATKIFIVALVCSLLFGCKKKSNTDFNYVFVKPYCASVTVGGVVGIVQKCFSIGDIVTGKKAENGIIIIRIAEHTAFNDVPSGPNSYQEFLDVPIENLKLN